MKAEKLAKESLRIRTRLYDTDHAYVGLSSGLLARILLDQDKLGIETKELYECSLAIDIKNFGSEGVNTAVSNGNLGNFYHQQAQASRSTEIRKEHLSLAVFKFYEALRIYTKLFGPDHPRTVKLSPQLSFVSHKISQDVIQLI